MLIRHIKVEFDLMRKNKPNELNNFSVCATLDEEDVKKKAR